MNKSKYFNLFPTHFILSDILLLLFWLNYKSYTADFLTANCLDASLIIFHNQDIELTLHIKVPEMKKNIAELTIQFSSSTMVETPFLISSFGYLSCKFSFSFPCFPRSSCSDGLTSCWIQKTNTGNAIKM